MSIKQIFEGWRNEKLPPKELKDKIESIKTERRDICKNCPFNSSCGEINSLSYCKSCGCNLKAKTACLSCSCPKNKWTSDVSREEAYEINEELKSNEDETSGEI